MYQHLFPLISFLWLIYLWSQMESVHINYGLLSDSISIELTISCSLGAHSVHYGSIITSPRHLDFQTLSYFQLQFKALLESLSLTESLTERSILLYGCRIFLIGWCLFYNVNFVQLHNFIPVTVLANLYIKHTELFFIFNPLNCAHFSTKPILSGSNLS